MSNFDIPLADLKIALTATVTHKPGAVRLDGYPLLVYAPSQHGQGVRTENNGTLVADIAAKVAELPDYARLAAHFGTSEEHVRQAVAYAVAVSAEA